MHKIKPPLYSPMRIQGNPAIEIPTRNMNNIIRTASTQLSISALLSPPSPLRRWFFRMQSPPTAPLVIAHRAVATNIILLLPNFKSKMELKEHFLLEAIYLSKWDQNREHESLNFYRHSPHLGLWTFLKLVATHLRRAEITATVTGLLIPILSKSWIAKNMTLYIPVRG